MIRMIIWTLLGFLVGYICSAFLAYSEIMYAFWITVFSFAGTGIGLALNHLSIRQKN